MENILIIGWYGTETIGDRAILGGIIHILSKVYDEYQIRIGSLFPPLTERTLIEDRNYFSFLSASKLKGISTFSSLDIMKLRCEIKNSTLVLVGGGPLMDLTVMYILEYAFSYAQKRHIKTILMGCGWGPLNTIEYKKCALRLIDKSDLIIFRDSVSKQQYMLHAKSNYKKCYALLDPAFITASQYLCSIKNKNPTHEYISVNLRDPLLININKNTLDATFIDTLNKILDYGMPIKLIPMHTFTIGGDDRYYLDSLAKKINHPNLYVQHTPLCLTETMETYYNSIICLGMRFHSIVLQTVLNGKNYILDYTNAQNGKIIGTLNELNLLTQYKDRYVNLNLENTIDHVDIDCPKIEFDLNKVNSYLEQYTSLLKSI